MRLPSRRLSLDQRAEQTTMSYFSPITVPDSPKQIGEGTASSPILVGDATPVRAADSPVKVIPGEKYRYGDLASY